MEEIVGFFSLLSNLKVKRYKKQKLKIMKFLIFSAFLLVLLINQSSGSPNFWHGCQPDFVENIGVTTGPIIHSTKIARVTSMEVTIGPLSVISDFFF